MHPPLGAAGQACSRARAALGSLDEHVRMLRTPVVVTPRLRVPRLIDEKVSDLALADFTCTHVLCVSAYTPR